MTCRNYIPGPNEWKARNVAFGKFLDNHHPKWRTWLDLEFMMHLENAFKEGWEAGLRKKK